MKVLVATEKPFSKVAVDGIRKIVEGAGYEFATLEKYTSPEELLAAVADVDALIVRSDKVTAEVVEAAKNHRTVPPICQPAPCEVQHKHFYPYSVLQLKFLNI